jgi:glutamate N-acetyltransferase / amino-acid N-acetyltransferase
METYTLIEVRSEIEHVVGFQVAGVHAGLKKDGALDMALIVSEVPCVAAGVFTTNRVKAAPVLVDMERLKANATHMRAVAVNTRCANACTGQQGIDNANQMAAWTAEAVGCKDEDVLVLSTGVIGTQLPMEKIHAGIEKAELALGHGWYAAAKAIMTTDTKPKLASVSVTKADGRRYIVAGMSKGAGMIAPNMATMLGVIITDAGMTAEQAQKALSAAAKVTYNRIVVDGDMSTNDTVLLLANGAAGAKLDSAQDEAQFLQALTAVSKKLAQDIVRDGEGVTKFITLSIKGAPDDAAALQIANAIATSPLVKTAFFGNDANWGRIVAAAGRSGVAIEPEKTRLWLSPGEVENVGGIALQLFDAGMPTDYSEETATAIIKEPSVSVILDCGMGSGSAVVWTCDLSHDYVSINGDYRS